jgi:hypothetical protein
MRFQRLKKVLRWTSRAILALAVLFVLFILEEHVRGHIMLARYKAELRAKGEKLTLEELNLPKPPKEGNGYAEIAAVGQQLNVLQRSSEFNVWFVTRLRWTEDGRPIVRCRQPDLGVRGSGTTAGTGGRRSRAIPSINDAGQLNRSELAKQRPSTNLVVQAGWADLARTVNAASNALARLNVVLTESVVAIPIDYTQGLAIRLSHWGEIRGIHHWLALTALQELHDGNLDAAIKNIALVAALTRICQQGRINLLQYERIGAGENGLDVTWETLQSPGWNNSQLDQLRAAWQVNKLLPDTIAALEVERSFAVSYFDKVRSSFGEWQKHRRSLLSKAQCGCENLRSDIAVSIYVALWRVAWLDQDELLLLKHYQNLLEATRKVVLGQVWQNVYHLPPDIPSFLHYGDLSRYFMTQFFEPSAESTTLRAMQFETRRQMTLTAIALKRFKIRHGHLPADLRELVPVFLTELPRDYLTDGPLHYRLETNGVFSLYSVGNDGHDDGGDPRPIYRKRLLSIWDGRDAVWPQPALER